MNLFRSNLPRWIKPVLAVGGLMVFLAVMAEFRAQRELDAARQAVRDLRLETALTLYSRALNWYVPFGASETAAEELLILGQSLAEKGREPEALLALERMRSGLYGDRSFFIPGKDLIRKAEPLMAMLRAKEKLGPDAPPDALKKQADEYLDLMERPARPGTGPGLAASAGFLIWVGGVLWFIFAAFSPAGFRWPRAWLPLACAFCGLAAWVWGMVWS